MCWCTAAPSPVGTDCTCQAAGYDKALADLHGKHSACGDVDWPTFQKEVHFNVKTQTQNCLSTHVALVLLLQGHHLGVC